MDGETDITVLLRRVASGDATALDRLFPQVYKELRRIAGRHLRKERTGHTLQPTALVHEAWIRLVRGEGQAYHNRAHFFAICSQMMRQILVDHARRHRAAKHGGGIVHLALDENFALDESQYDTLIALDQALKRLEQIDSRMVRVIELRFFGGLTVDETAAALQVSDRTVKRDWDVAQRWLSTELKSYRAGSDAG